MTLLSFLRPVDPREVMYFDEWKGELSQRVRHKADVFLARGLISYLGEGKYCCNPIPGYNKTPHVMERKEGAWTCTCQGFRMKEKSFGLGLSPNPPFCSHLLGLMHYFKAGRKA